MKNVRSVGAICDYNPNTGKAERRGPPKTDDQTA